MNTVTKSLAAGALLAMSLTSTAAEANDCMMDNSGNFWGDCSEGFQVTNNGPSVTVIAPMPPGATETALNLIFNVTGVWGTIADSANAVAQFMGGWSTMGETTLWWCSDHWSNCAGY